MRPLRKQTYRTPLRLLLCLLLALPACTPKIPGLDTSELPLEISGIKNALRDNVVAILADDFTLDAPPQITSRRLQQFARMAPQRVAEALQPFGYYTPQTRTRIEDQILHLDVDPGPPVRVATLETRLDGCDAPLFQTALERFPLHTGDILDHRRYEEGKEQLLRMAQELGYLSASYSLHSVQVTAETQRADVALTLECGPRYLVGELRFTGADDYPEAFLRRYLTLREGMPLSQEEIFTTQQQLRDSDRFDLVVVTPEREQSDSEGRTPVLIELTPKARRELRPGIGYGTDTGARFSLRYQDRNAFRRGHELLVSGLLAEYADHLSLDYILPGDALNTRTTLHAGLEQEDVDSYTTRYVFSEIEQAWEAGMHQVVSVFARYQLEQSDIAGEEIDANFLLAGLRYRLASLDNTRRPTSGYHLYLEGRGSDTSMLSDVSLLQLLAGARLLVPLRDTLLLHLRSNAAATFQEDALEDIPASLRFFAGGDRSVRGYAYQSLGPLNSLGEVVGGKNLLVASLELEWRILEDWGVAGFYDTGNAFNSFSDMELAEGAGLGIRYYSVVGPVWLDGARTIGTIDADYRLHFGLGISW